MDLNEMHVWFRQYAQQMGMQNVRAILPEQIDVLINTSISDVVSEIINSHVGITNDRVITDNSKIGNINSLRTLSRSVELTILNNSTGGIGSNPVLPFERMLQRLTISPLISAVDSSGVVRIPNCLYLIDFAIQYGMHRELYWSDNPSDYTIEGTKLEDSIRTSFYPIRLIEAMYLADTLQDYILAPKLRSPIAVYKGSRSAASDNDVLQIYFGEDVKSPKSISMSICPVVLLVNYIAKPAKVQYRQDFNQDNINCDLPETLHVPILKHAVDLYRVAIQGSLYANQQQQQAQQREVGRNNVRPDNEGYQN